MKILKKAILPIGFKANGVFCGLKKSAKPDLGLIYSILPAKAGCVSTLNTIQAAPLRVNNINLKKSKVFHAILVNSGNANCFTGQAGLTDAWESAKCLACSLAVKKSEVLLASTGIIGKRLAVQKIIDSLPALVRGLSSGNIDKAAKAILTTDLIKKEVTATFMLGKIKATICGIAKGSGMIAPNMATMLSFIMTDVNIDQGALNRSLRSAVDESFNCITVDGCMSTNDTVIVLANGMCENKMIKTGSDLALFVKALKTVCLELAKLIVKDGEGATKFIEIRVRRARTPREARIAALAVANSNLFKTAVYGENPNFGRVVAAIGASGIGVKEKDISVRLSPLAKDNVLIDVSLGQGKDQAVIYTSDLSPEYIKINAAYN